MNRQYYLDLADAGLCMPIGTDLVLHEHSDWEQILLDGDRLGHVLEETARRFHTPLAVPHMNLELEKFVMLQLLGIPQADIAKFHFSNCPDAAMLATLRKRLDEPFTGHLQAHIDSVKYIATQTDLLPIGMAIGPFSLMTKLIADPITPIAMAGAGMTGDDDDEIKMVETVLEMAITIIVRSIAAQVDAGAKAIFIAEPAANKVFISPNQMESGSDIFDRLVMTYNNQITAYLAQHGVDLIFHCCGELIDAMVKKFAELHPVILSLGSSRNLWEDAALVPDDIVLFGNLPSKRFYSDALYNADQVKKDGQELCERMRATGHPFILGSECDVLSVPGCEDTIVAKATAITGCGCCCATV
ncbi:MAG TPA: uroporphyrinogen decarboxylase family protein [Armatimonadota bacterium]|nr:uroporphyrinogen decarboxylase family protein [Armatimonadota bacterium]